MILNKLMVPYIYEAALFYWLASNARTVMTSTRCYFVGLLRIKTVFSPEFTGQRGQIIFYDHTPRLECSDCQYQTFVGCVPLSTKPIVGIQSPDSFYVQVVQVGAKNMLVLRWSQRAHCFFCSRP